MDLTVKDILKASKGKLIVGNENLVCSVFSKDTRIISQGDVYIGIKGENFDGNLFWKDAFKNGASCVIVQNIDFAREKLEEYRNRTIILVEDTLQALYEIARAKRDLYDIPVIAITGSVGKTSTKDIIANVVSQKYKTLKTIGNNNNNIGLPFTILRMKDEEAMVLEMGMNHFGEISLLTSIAKPNICVITNIGTSHIGNLGSRENILKAKLEILEGTKNPTVIVNNDNDLLSKWYENNKNKYNIKTFGISNKSDINAENIVLDKKSSTYSSNIEGKKYNITVPIGGEHFVLNSLCATLVGEELNIEMPDDIRELCEQLELFDEINLGENEVASQVLIEKVKTNILMNIFCHTSNGEISKEVLEENDNGMNVNDYTICMDSNGAIRVDIKEDDGKLSPLMGKIEVKSDNNTQNKENNSYYLPIRFSRKLLPYGIIEKEQDIMRYIDNNLEAIMRNSFKKNSNKLNEAYKLFQELKELRDGTEYNIKYIDGRYYIENNENKSIVEISLELNNHIVELEKNIFKAIRKSKTNEKNDYIKDLDLKSYYSLQKMLDLGFTFEIERENEPEPSIVNNTIIVTSPTGRTFSMDIEEIPDLDFTELPFTKESKLSNRLILKKENLDKEIELINDVNSKIVELKSKLKNKEDKTYYDVRELTTEFINDTFLNSEYSIVRKNGMYYIEKDLYNIQLTDMQCEFLSGLEEELFETIYNSEKEGDFLEVKRDIQDVHGCNALIEMIKLGYKIQLPDNKELKNKVIIKSPTGREMERDFSEFGNVNIDEIIFDNKVNSKSKHIVLEELEKYTELSEYINQVFNKSFFTSERNLENKEMNIINKSCSIKELLDVLNPKDRDMSIKLREDGQYVICSGKDEFKINLNEELSARIDRLFERYIDVLAEGNQKAITNENGEKIGINYNSQKTIIELWEKGYSFNVKDNNIEVVSPLGKKFEVSVESFNKRGLPYSKTTFKQVEEFKKAEKETQNYDTENFYEFLMSKLKYDGEYIFKNRILNDPNEKEKQKTAKRYENSAYYTNGNNFAQIDESDDRLTKIIEEKIKELGLEQGNKEKGVDRND